MHTAHTASVGNDHSIFDLNQNRKSYVKSDLQIKSKSPNPK